MFEIKVTGFQELERALRRLPEEIAGKVLTSALRKASTPMATEAAQFAPRSDAPGPDGHMADSIKVRLLKESSGLNDVEVNFWIGPDRRHFYGLFWEFGTINQPAESFLRPAFDEEKQNVIDALGKELWKEIERAVRKLA